MHTHIHTHTHTAPLHSVEYLEVVKSHTHTHIHTHTHTHSSLLNLPGKSTMELTLQTWMSLYAPRIEQINVEYMNESCHTYE